MGLLLKIVKLTLAVLVGFLLVLLLFGLVLILDWPRWMLVFLLLGLIGLAVGGLFIKKLLLRRKEQQFVQQVIEQDEASLRKLADRERDEFRDLQERWKEAIETLRRSHLKKRGNPLYVLPWYLVMGESGSGKSTALNSARLSSPFLEVKRTSGVSGTRNCDWWFFEQAIVIDTAGRYAIPVDEGKDKEEWQRFLSLLVKYRKREPIHGLIITVAADKLLAGAAEALEADGRKIRSRIDELMRVLGVRFPVYVLVTKCDLIQGMSAFSEQLPEKSLDQPMGLINQELSGDVAAFVDAAVKGIGERLREYRLLLLHQAREGRDPADALLFPEEFENLAKGLVPFLTGAFQENPYQETPALRGLFFSSGRQEGTPFSHFLGALGLIAEKEVLPSTSKGLFLHDFFAGVLPKDRGLFAPTRRVLEWQGITRNLGLASWMLVWLALSGLLGYSFVRNMSTIRDATSHSARPPELSGNPGRDLAEMERYRSMVAKVEARNRKWWIPRFGLHQSRKVEAALKERYCSSFKARFLFPFDAGMSEAAGRLTPASPDMVVSQHIDHLVRRIDLLRTRRGGGSLEVLQSKPHPVFTMAGEDQGEEPGRSRTFGALYLSYLAWRSDPRDIDAETAALQKRLAELVELKGGDLLWLISWANRQESVAALTLQQFWGGSNPVPGERTVPPAFTRKGKERIDALVAEIGNAYPERERWEHAVSSFERSYRGACYASWQEFARFFPKGAGRLKGPREWREAAGKMPGEEGPYRSFFRVASAELKPLAGREPLPPWLQQLYEFLMLESGGAGRIAAKSAEKGKKVIRSIEQALGKGAQEEPAGVASVSAAAKAVRDYLDSLHPIAPAERREAFQLALQVFAEDAEAGKSPFNAAFAAADRLTGSLQRDGGDDTFARLVRGPVEFLWAFTRQEAACSLQGLWDEKVLQEAQGGMDQQMMQYLLGPEGPVWKFVKGPAAPFLGWSPGRGYYSKEALGGTLPFEPAFFAFLSRGARAKVTAPVKQSYIVTVRGLPTDANPEARTMPQVTRLELLCAESQVLENLNFPVARTFKWSPEGCGDVILSIQLGELTLTRTYRGPQGFPRFLHDFPGGRHTFYAREFPGQSGALEALGIRYLSVNYQFSGEQPGLGPAKALPQWAPKSILRCWG